MQLDGASYVLNPYTSAFFGLAAGLFTDRAYLLLVGIVEKMKENLDGSFDLQLESIRDTGHRPKRRTKDLPATVDVSAGKPSKPEETTSEPGAAG